ncbi:unnamed protein product [Xylocopa violacea]|uniref:Uncharacterized protein n=1 Tax=Xylocopa violacea TaxID=135666 RepID=A0ABP1NAJ2_XYLVO
MLEPLIVLTVLNCFFMFSSTVTTCALWWQYRSHRCCFKKDSRQQSARYNLSKSRNSNSVKKTGNSKLDNHTSSVDRSKSNSTVNRENRKKRTSRHKSSSNAKYLSQSKTPSDDRLSSMETIGNWDLEDKSRMSEASQTANEAKPAVVMEYSTVQKIVQILDNDTDLAATKLAIKDLNAKQNVDEKKDYIVESQFEPQPMHDYPPVAHVQFN